MLLDLSIDIKTRHLSPLSWTSVENYSTELNPLLAHYVYGKEHL